MPNAEIKGVRPKLVIGGTKVVVTKVVIVSAATAGTDILATTAGDRLILTGLWIHTGKDVTGDPVVSVRFSDHVAEGFTTAKLNADLFLPFGNGSSILLAGNDGEDLEYACVWGAPAGSLNIIYSYFLIQGG